jgi:hypothetical protein
MGNNNNFKKNNILSINSNKNRRDLHQKQDKNKKIIQNSK